MTRFLTNVVASAASMLSSRLGLTGVSRIVAFDDHVAQINTDAELHASIVRLTGVALCHAFLDFDSALDSIDHTRQLDQQSIARGLDDAAAMARDRRLDQLSEMRVEPGARSLLVLAHEPGVSRHVCSEDGGEAALDGIGHRRVLRVQERRLW